MGSQQARALVIVVLGPTASGKTAVAVELARRSDGEVISADSRAFFAGLDIVTDKPLPPERGDVPHHLIDCVPIDGTYDAMMFRSDVERLLPEIRGRHRQPIIAGGGTLYLGAILHGIFEGPARDDVFRSALKQRTSEDLFRELTATDPRAAERIHPNDRLRMTRALEVYRATGVPISDLQSEAEPIQGDFHVVGLHRDRTEHRALIEERVRRMLDRGVIDEIARLRTMGLSQDAQAFRTIGVPEAFHVLDGDMTREEYVHVVTHRTWQLVRRQMAWFRRDDAVCWIDGTHRTAACVAEQILSDLRSNPHCPLSSKVVT
jgi:tRNA dimethylallyltransferase